MFTVAKNKDYPQEIKDQVMAAHNIPDDAIVPVTMEECEILATKFTIAIKAMNCYALVANNTNVEQNNKTTGKPIVNLVNHQEKSLFRDEIQWALDWCCGVMDELKESNEKHAKRLMSERRRMGKAVMYETTYMGRIDLALGAQLKIQNTEGIAKVQAFVLDNLTKLDVDPFIEGYEECIEYMKRAAKAAGVELNRVEDEEFFFKTLWRYVCYFANQLA